DRIPRARSLALGVAHTTTPLPCARLRRCAATRRIPATNTRSASASLLDEEVSQARERLESDDPWRVGHEVGKSVDVVVVESAVARIERVLDAPDFNAAGACDLLDLPSHLRRRLVAFHPQPIARRIDRAGAAHQLSAAGRLAHVSRTKVERLAGRVDSDRVQELAAQDFYPRDASFFGRNELLNQRRLIGTQLQPVVGRRNGQVRRCVETSYARAAAA